MKSTTAYAIAWISVSVAVSIGIYLTSSLMPLWAFLIPAHITITDKG